MVDDVLENYANLRDHVDTCEIISRNIIPLLLDILGN